jgi:hypothetical protein
MDTDPSVALPLLQLGLLMGVVIVAHGFAARRMPVGIIPGCLQPRVTLCNKLRPWLSAAALAMTLTGLVLIVG